MYEIIKAGGWVMWPILISSVVATPLALVVLAVGLGASLFTAQRTGTVVRCRSVAAARARGQDRSAPLPRRAHRRRPGRRLIAAAAGEHVPAVLAWLPQARSEQLRRLQMAAQNFQQQLFVMRPLAAQHEASPAVLRLALEAGEDADALTLRLLKRRGPPLSTPLVLPARPERLQALLAASRQQATRRRQGSAAAPTTQSPAPLTPLAPVPPQRDDAAASAPAGAGLGALLNTRVPAGADPCGGSGALDRLVAPAVR